MGFWDNLKSSATVWMDAGSAQNRADSIIKSVTGVDPKFFHPEVYKAVTQSAHQQYERYRLTEQTPLTAEEVAMVKLMAFCVLLKDAEQNDMLQTFGKGISTLRKSSGEKVRAAISLSAGAETGF